MEDTVSFFGHENIRATHNNTLEITKEEDVSSRGDCIVGVRSSKACFDLSNPVKARIIHGNALAFEIRVGKDSFRFTGLGSPTLSLDDQREIVLRKSDYASERTLAIKCSAAAADLPRILVSKLGHPDCKAQLVIRALNYVPEEKFEWTLP